MDFTHSQPLYKHVFWIGNSPVGRKLRPCSGDALGWRRLGSEPGQCPVSLQAPPAEPSSERIPLTLPNPLIFSMPPGPRKSSFQSRGSWFVCSVLSVFNWIGAGSAEALSGSGHQLWVHERISQQVWGSTCPRSPHVLVRVRPQSPAAEDQRPVSPVPYSNHQLGWVTCLYEHDICCFTWKTDVRMHSSLDFNMDSLK